jgi:hypothetical protein
MWRATWITIYLNDTWWYINLNQIHKAKNKKRGKVMGSFKKRQLEEMEMGIFQDEQIEEEDKLSDEEEKKLKKRLRDIEIEQRHAWGLHRISGGFVSADYDYVDDDKIYITLTDGIQSDCQNTTNVTHCSLWRDSLEWTD